MFRENFCQRVQPQHQGGSWVGGVFHALFVGKCLVLFNFGFGIHKKKTKKLRKHVSESFFV